jgi:hypothetical protein
MADELILPPTLAPTPAVALDEIDVYAPDAARKLLSEQLLRVRAARVLAETARGLDVRERVKLETLEKDLLVHLAKLNGELSVAEEDKLTRTNKFKRILDVISETLAEHPDLRAKLLTALDAL